MQLPGPFDINRILEFECPFSKPDYIFPDATEKAFAECKVATDPAYVDQGTGYLIMSFHSILIQTGRSTILVDTCVGNHKERPLVDVWHNQNRPYLERLSAAGVGVEDIDFVFCTHMHADHVGWNTKLENGRWVPTFPNAKYIFAQTEVAHWEKYFDQDPEDPGRRAWQDSVEPVLDADQAMLVKTDFELETGVRLIPAPGHTPGNVILELAVAGDRVLLTGDVLHHPVQIERPHWSSHFCSDPEQSHETRRNLLETIADTGTIILPAHFAAPSAVRITSDSHGFDFSPAH